MKLVSSKVFSKVNEKGKSHHYENFHGSVGNTRSQDEKQVISSKLIYLESFYFVRTDFQRFTYNNLLAVPSHRFAILSISIR